VRAVRRALVIALLPLALWLGAPAASKAPSKPPVVMVIMDEFPTESLRGPDGRIDAARYPNFARLAAMSTWFRNSTTIYDSTPKAVPAIMDARMPFKGETWHDHRGSVYTLFGERGYRIFDSEEATAVCPRRFCANAHPRPPGILNELHGGRPQRFEAWVRSIGRGKRPGFWIKHVLLPHGPWLFLPSGKKARPSVKDPVPGLASVAGFGDRGLTNFNRQRYMLQLGFADRELGKLLDRLQSTGLLDRALLVVTADHGFSWEVGVKDRRKVTPSNVDQIGPQPLFIKSPRQRRGAVNKAYVRTIDIVPTMADILGLRIGWRHDGRSAFSPATRRRRVVRLPNRAFTRIVKISAAALERRRSANLRRQTRLFGSGAQSKLVFGDAFATLYRAVPHRELLGRPLASLARAKRGRLRASLATAGLTRSVNLRSDLVPNQIAGSLHGGRRGAKRDVAVVVNGFVQSVGHTFYLAGSRTESFSVMVPEGALRQGRNDVRVFGLSKRGRGVVLTAL
jgi:hypothetical protein